MAAGCGCADEKVVSSAGSWQSLAVFNTKLMVEEVVGVEGVDARPLVQDGELKHFCASSKVEIVTKLTNCEFWSEIRQRLLSLVNIPSWMRYS